MRKIILFELNEVPFKIIDYYCQKHPESVFAKTLSQCAQYETVTEDVGHLHPWVTWPTMHRGIPNTAHGIEDFGENMTETDAKFPPIWGMLHKNGIHTGVYSSMHSFPPPPEYKEYAFFVPDPFAADARVHPEKIKPFQEFNLVMSRKSSRNVDSGIDMKSAAKLLLSLPKIGIKAHTVRAVGKQLARERFQAWTKTRRRVYQSVLAFDVFMNLLEEQKPAFSTFLTNHAASVMHRYWAATFPEDYEKNTLTYEWMNTYSGEIDFAMGQFNGFFERIKKFTDANPEYVLVIASSMGQEASKAELRSTESYVKDFDKLALFLGLQPSDWEKKPAMHPQYNLTVKPEKADAFRENLLQLQIDGRPFQFREKEGGFFSLDFGHPNMAEEKVSYKGKEHPFSELGLTNEKIDDESAGTAYHIPEGILLVYNPKDLSYKGKRQGPISTCSFAPSILQHFGIEVPGYMAQSRIKELVEC